MPDTTNRPTPEQLVADLEITPGSVLAHLGRHDYVIVHPDDVPVADSVYAKSRAGERRGFNACRAHIFGDDQ